MATMLATDSVPAFLRARGLSTTNEDDISVEKLTGGVSGAVFSTNDGVRRLVVKQSLDKLAVADDWTAPRDRILTEARVLNLIGEIIPGHSPIVFDVDEQSLTITMEHAPSDWIDWKTELLTGVVDTTLSRNLGAALGMIHTASQGMAWSLPPDDGTAGFLALRIEPFHHTVAARLPELADPVLEVARRTLARQTTLVHGDFSPKNILVAPAGHASDRAFWIIDDEVGHRGDPTFDLGFFLSHLALKAIQAGHPTDREFGRAGAEFIAGYLEHAAAPDSLELSQQIGILMLSRVVGRSRVNYLDQRQQRVVIAAGTELLLHPNQFTLSLPLAHTRPD